ncbi:MAG TPA: hypothetical protein VKQ73_04780 [Stellaceae bacterium]|nr:hypothetical protein [Stellaceae bacterium]
MIEIERIRYPKSALDSAPEAERIFYLMIGQLGNDLNYLTKLTTILLNDASIGDVNRRANTSLTIYLVKTLAGRLYEGSKLLEGPVLKTVISDYKLSDHALDSLENIKRHFNKKSNIIKTIRNKFAFHTEESFIREGYQQFPDDHVLTDYESSKFYGHDLYYATELITVKAIAEAIGEKDWHDVPNTIAREVGQLALLFGHFISEYAATFRERYLDSNETERNKITIDDAPRIDEITIPFFCEPPKNWPE